MIDQIFKKILRAPVYQVARETPLQLSHQLSKKYHCNIYLKREDLQPIFSFKLRGAFNKMIKLNENERKTGVIASSAGNHAQGVALAAKKLDIKALIVMPMTTPHIKVEAVKNLQADVILHGENYDAAFEKAQSIKEKEGYTFIHPFDDFDVIAGQGTVALELTRQMTEIPEVIFVPVGGGGLLAGITAYIKSVYPETKIIGVEPIDSAKLTATLKENQRVCLEQTGLFAEGVAVKQLGECPWQIIQNQVTEAITVSVDEICSAIKDIFNETRSVAEPAGAVALAGLKKYIQQGNQFQNATAIVSGANMNFDRLRYVSERSQTGEYESLFCVTIPEESGSFLKFCELLIDRTITEFNYRFYNSHEANVFVGIAIENKQESLYFEEKFQQCGYKTYDLTDNELAKAHIRYMVGGRATSIENEKLFRFEFPERPKALYNFLSKMGGRWNISLFHYRNHGAAFGRVFIGVQIPPAETDLFQEYLEKINYVYVEETDNPAYSFFL